MSTRALVASFLLLAACSGGPTSTSSSATAADAGTDEPPATLPDGGGATAPSTPKEQCETLIACVADIDPGSAGALVTLYGDASNCWKGSASDAEACGKACAKNLEQHPECSAAPLDRHYLALCTASLAQEAMRYDVELAFDPRKGGEATFRPLPMSAQKYRSGDALVTQPKVALEVESGGGAGETTTPFDVPGAAFDPYGNAPTVHVTKFAVRRLRVEKGNVCSEIEATVTTPYSTSLRGACVYLPLADGATVPGLTRTAIESCNPSEPSPSP